MGGVGGGDLNRTLDVVRQKVIERGGLTALMGAGEARSRFRRSRIANGDFHIIDRLRRIRQDTTPPSESQRSRAEPATSQRS